MKPTQAHNPDHYRDGTRVIPSMEATKQAIGRHVGTVVSRYPNEQIVTVKWNGKSRPERWHVDLLDIIK